MNIQVERIVIGPFKENTYLVWNKGDSDCLVVGPGEDGMIIIQSLKDADMEPVAIINTQVHLDHIGAVQDLKNEFGIPFFYIKMKIAY